MRCRRQAFFLACLGIVMGISGLPEVGNTQNQCTTICINHGYPAIDFCTYAVHRSRIEVRERFLYVGVDEGHDCSSSLLQGCRAFRSTPSVCNISRGTCAGCDEGCAIPLACSGRANDPVCRPGQECVGERSSVGIGPWMPYDRVSSVMVTSTHPADCDCRSCHTGWRGYYTVWSYNGDFDGESKVPMGGQCVSDAGCMYHEGWDGVHYVDRGCLCGTINISGYCTTTGVVITSTISRSLRSGNPDFYIPPQPYCLCEGKMCCSLLP